MNFLTFLEKKTLKKILFNSNEVNFFYKMMDRVEKQNIRSLNSLLKINDYLKNKIKFKNHYKNEKKILTQVRKIFSSKI